MATTYTPVLENAIADFEAATGNTGFVRMLCDTAYIQGKHDGIKEQREALENDTLPDCYAGGFIPEVIESVIL